MSNSYIRINEHMIRLISDDDVSDIAQIIADENISQEDAISIIEAMIKNEIVSLNSDIDIRDFYDIFITAHRWINDNELNADEYFKMMSALETSVNETNKFSGFGKIFASPVFEDKMLREIADTIRSFSGPSKSEGLYPCNRCGATRKDVSSEVIQRRSADEAPTVFNACNKCGARWKING